MKSITTSGLPEAKVVCHPPKLLSILLQENIEWPSGMVWCVQDDDGEIKFSSDSSFKPIYCNNGIWSRGRIAGNDTTVHGYLISNDWNKIVISYEEYKKAKQLYDNHDSSWFERGEKPPVGCECEVFDGRDWLQSFIVGCSLSGDIVVQTGSGYYEASDAKFRPLRTKREKAIEDMKSICKYKGSWDSTFKAFAEDLIDAGYHKD